MPSLCPTCGWLYCDHSPAERGQTQEEFREDMDRHFTVEEYEAFGSGDSERKLAVAQAITSQKKAGTFQPRFPPDPPLY